MKKIRVLHFTEVINRYDFIDVIIRFSDPNRFNMQAATYTLQSNIENPLYKGQNIAHHSLQIKWGYIGFVKGVWKLAKLIRAERIDILHTHHYYEAVMGRLACWLNPGCRHVVGRHYHNDLYLTTHGLKLRLYLSVERLVNMFSAAIISPSTHINELLVRQQVPRSKVWFIPYGFDFSASRYKPISDEQKRKLRLEMGGGAGFLIGNFSRHHPIKGQVDLLSAFKSFSSKHSDVCLLMVGDGPYRSVLEKYVEDNDLGGKVKFLGWRKDGHTLMNAMDVIVHATLQEAFPQTMIEVMALGIPLLICPVSGASDVIQHELNGILIPFNSPQSIEFYLEKFYTDRTWARDLGSRARTHVSRYEIKNIIPLYERVYETVCK